MKKITGVVVKVDKNYVCVRTVRGEFYNLKLQDHVPKIGDIHSAPIATSNSTAIKRLIFIGTIVILFFFGKNIYNYFAPSTTIIVNIPPTIQLKVNKWDKIVDVKATRSSGRDLIKSINLKNKSIDKGLELIFEEAKRKSIIDKNYTDNNGVITIYIPDKDGQDIDLSSFIKYAKERKVDCQVNYDGTDLLNHQF